MKSVERRYKRTESFKCASVEYYGSINEEDSDPEDEVNVFGERSPRALWSCFILTQRSSSFR